MLFHELIRFKGQRSGSSEGSKDDNCDSLGSLTATYLEKDTGISREKSEAQLELEAQLEGQRALRLQHDMYFGSAVPPQQQYIPSPEPDRDNNPLTATLGRFGMTRNAA